MEQQDNPKSMKSGKIKTVIAIVAIVVGLVWIASLFFNFRNTVTTDSAQVEQYLSPINAKVGGYVKEIRFTEHQYVHKGDTLLIIDDREYAIRLMEAEAALKDAEAASNVMGATIARTESSVPVFDAQTKEIQAQIAEIEARIAQLRHNKARYENLVERKAATPMQLETIETELTATEAKLAAAQAKIATVNRQKQTAVNSVDEVQRRQANTQAAVMRATAAVDMAKLNISYSVITAPCDGWLGRRSIEDGQLINAGQTITNIIPNGEKWIVANYKESQIKHLHVGQAVKIKIDAFPKEEFSGKIVNISAATGSKYSMVPTDNSAGNFVKIQQRIPVRIDFTDLSAEESDKLAAGMMAVVSTKK